MNGHREFSILMANAIVSKKESILDYKPTDEELRIIKSFPDHLSEAATLLYILMQLESKERRQKLQNK